MWETTLDTNARSLLQVRVKEVDEANVLFDQLMGDLVEPRRQFIQDNALSRERGRLDLNRFARGPAPWLGRRREPARARIARSPGAGIDARQKIADHAH